MDKRDEAEVQEELSIDIDDSKEIVEKEQSVEVGQEDHNHKDEVTQKSNDELIDEARAMVTKSDSEVRDCMDILNDDLEAYESKKSKLINGNIAIAESLLNDIEFEPEPIKDIGKDGLQFRDKEPIKPMHIKSLSSGKFSSFILAIIFGLASVAGWVYLATQKLGITLDPSKMPSDETKNQILSWIGGSVTGGEGVPLYGLAILATTAIIVMWIIYAIRVSMRSTKNKKIAHQVNEDAKFYCTKKEECKREMEKVSEHLHKVIKVLDKYDVLFEEQNAKIKRIIYIEGKLPFHEYHQISKDHMNETGRLIDSLNRLISTQMADEAGSSLSIEAIEALEDATKNQDQYIEKLYQ